MVGAVPFSTHPWAAAMADIMGRLPATLNQCTPHATLTLLVCPLTRPHLLLQGPLQPRPDGWLLQYEHRSLPLATTPSARRERSTAAGSRRLKFRARIIVPRNIFLFFCFCKQGSCAMTSWGARNSGHQPFPSACGGCSTADWQRRIGKCATAAHPFRVSSEGARTPSRLSTDPTNAALGD